LFQGQVRNGFFRTQHTYGLESPSPHAQYMNCTHAHTRGLQTKIWAYFFFSVFRPLLPPLFLIIYIYIYIFLCNTSFSILTMPGSIKGQCAPLPVNGWRSEVNDGFSSRLPPLCTIDEKKHRNYQNWMSPLYINARFSFDSDQYLYHLLLLY
jgi:hypothetical protein